MSFETQEAVVAELQQYAANEADLYPQRQSIEMSLAIKKARGVYKRDLAVKAFGYFADAGAKKYAKEFGGTWHKMFDVPTRRAVAKNLTTAFEEEHKLGNYDRLLPKKYQKQAKAPASHHARKVKSMGDYEAEGYAAHTWYLADSPYQQPKIRDAWQRGAWKWQQEQRAKKNASAPGHARMKRSAQLDREIANVVPAWRRGH